MKPVRPAATRGMTACNAASEHVSTAETACTRPGWRDCPAPEFSQKIRAQLPRGTNDSKARFGCNSHLISLGIVRLVKKALHTECWRDNARPDVLVIVPPSITPEYDHLIFKDAMGTGCHERCAGIAAQLEPMLKDIANVRFLDANTLPGAGCSPLDGMHMTVQSHKVLAKALQKALTGDAL